MRRRGKSQSSFTVKRQLGRGDPGSLVNIAFHVKSDASLSEATTVQLLKSQTVLADAQAAMILGPGLDWTSVLTGDWVHSLI